MKNSSNATERAFGGKRTILRFPEGSGWDDLPDPDCILTDDDCLVLRELLLRLGTHDGAMELQARRIAEARENHMELPNHNVRLEVPGEALGSWTLPASPEDLATLKHLDLRHLRITSLPSWIDRLVPGLEELDLPSTLRELNVGNLPRLERLVLGFSKIARLPDAIGDLAQLRELDLTYTEHLTALPERLGDLRNLETLTIWSPSMAILPDSIGRLTNLRTLDLSETERLAVLPDTIGDLGELRDLCLTWSRVSELPASIGRLSNLRNLVLSHTKHLKRLPEELGGLTRLQTLSLKWSRISELPESIGNLRHLEDCNLSHTTHLTKLPASLGNLRNLTRLRLVGSSVTTLPDEIGSCERLEVLDLQNAALTAVPVASLGRLPGLVYLNLYGTKLPELEASPVAFWLALCRSCPALGSLGKKTEEGRSKLGNGHRQLGYALACNRARFRTGLGASSQSAKAVPPGLWPKLLHEAPRAFARYPCPGPYLCGSAAYTISAPDAVYQLLADGRDSLVRVLVDRGSGSNNINSNASNSNNTSRFRTRKNI